MSRLQKRCLIGSALSHALLLVLLLIGPAFFVSKPKPAEDLPVLDYIPAKLIDEAFFGGGGPRATAPPPATPPRTEPPAPRPRPREANPQPSKPIVTRPPESPVAKADPPPPKAAAPKASPPTPAPRPKPKIDLSNVVTRDDSGQLVSKAQRERAEAEARARQAAEQHARVQSVLQHLQANLSADTEIQPLGAGGLAYANYAQAIKSIYQQAWQEPTEAASERDEVEVEVIIARDGAVLSARITKKSGNPALDKSVRQALDRVKQVPPFPEGATEDKRTFNILFRLKANRLSG
jgi:TonB family protein